MKANEYINKYGVDCAKEILKHNQDLMNIGFFTDIKRLVESHELVKEHGTIERAKEYANSPYTAPEVKERLKQAIADVESCMEASSESSN